MIEARLICAHLPCVGEILCHSRLWFIVLYLLYNVHCIIIVIAMNSGVSLFLLLFHILYLYLSVSIALLHTLPSNLSICLSIYHIFSFTFSLPLSRWISLSLFSQISLSYSFFLLSSYLFLLSLKKIKNLLYQLQMFRILLSLYRMTPPER